MVGISYALWGAVFGWILMPGFRGPRSGRGARIAAYFAALALALSVNQLFHFQRQVLLFLLGMAAQSGVTFIAKFVRRLKVR